MTLKGKIHDTKSLSALENIEQDLIIDCVVENDSFQLEGLEFIGGNLLFLAKGSKVCQFNRLRSIQGEVYIETPNATAIALPKLDSVNGKLIVENAPNLSRLALGNLKSVEGDFKISNSNLSSLNSLRNLKSVGGDLQIVDNPLLKDCTGICTLLIEGEIHGLSNVEIVSTDGVVQKFDCFSNLEKAREEISLDELRSPNRGEHY